MGKVDGTDTRVGGLISRRVWRWLRWWWVPIGAVVGLAFGAMWKLGATGGQGGAWAVAGLSVLGMLLLGIGGLALLVVLVTRGRAGRGWVGAMLLAAVAVIPGYALTEGHREAMESTGSLIMRSSMGQLELPATCGTGWDSAEVAVIRAATGSDQTTRIGVELYVSPAGPMVTLVHGGAWMDYRDVRLRVADPLRRSGVAEPLMHPIQPGDEPFVRTAATERLELEWTCD